MYIILLFCSQRPDICGYLGHKSVEINPKKQSSIVGFPHDLKQVYSLFVEFFAEKVRLLSDRLHRDRGGGGEPSPAAVATSVVSDSDAPAQG